MNWHNLRTFNCPYCTSKLIRGDDSVLCSECTFVISNERFRSISVHRAGTYRPVKPMKWQNLKKDLCPICDNTLVHNMDGTLDFMKCMTADCTFKIRQDHMNDILNDDGHPCNIFHRKYQGTQLPDNE